METKQVKLKSLKIKIYPNENQKKILNEFINTSRYIYNKTLELLKNGYSNNFYNLRNTLVTYETKKEDEIIKKIDNQIKEIQMSNLENTEKELELLKKQKSERIKLIEPTINTKIKDFELRTPKEIRANAVKQCSDALKTGITNLKNGNIKYFNMKFRKKKNKQQGIELQSNQISFLDGNLKILPRIFQSDSIIKIHNRMKKKIIKNKIAIHHNSEIIRNHKEYFLYVVVPTTIKEKKENPKVISGIDLGIRTFATIYSDSEKENSITEINIRNELLKKYNEKLKILRNRKKIRRNQLSKYEKKKKNLIDSFHWESINEIISNSDIVYLGLINSHNIVRGNKNKVLNTNCNDLKFYQFRQRLLYKASVNQKQVFLVKEQYTTKTCSSCGILNKEIGSSKVFCCKNCNLVTDRDHNASKNILMKGILN